MIKYTVIKKFIEEIFISEKYLIQSLTLYLKNIYFGIWHIKLLGLTKNVMKPSPQFVHVAK